MPPQYSIVCPAYNAEKYIEATIQSVLAQTRADWELIIIDDGSTDGTASRVANYRDKRIHLIRQANHGQSLARNVGAKASQGDRLMFLDSDDLLHPDALARLGNALDRADAIASYGQCRYISEDGRVIGQRYHARRGYPPSGDLLPFFLTRNLFVNGGHVCARASVIRNMEGFRSDLSPLEDHEFWCRLAARGSIVFIDDELPVLDYRIRWNSEYRRLGRKPAIYARLIEAIFANPDLVKDLSPVELRRLRRDAEASADWTIAAEYIRHGDWITARQHLAKSLSRKFDAKRAAVMVFALFGGVPGFVAKRVPALQTYDFLLDSSAPKADQPHSAAKSG